MLSNIGLLCTTNETLLVSFFGYYCSLHGYLKIRRRLQADDVLIIEGNGSADHIGRAAIFRGEIDDCVHQNHVIRIRPDRHQLEPDYLNLYLNSPHGQEKVDLLKALQAETAAELDARPPAVLDHAFKGEL